MYTHIHTHTHTHFTHYTYTHTLHIYTQQEDDVMVKDKEEEIVGPDGQKLDPNDPKALIAKASATVDDEYESRKGSDKNYYQIAHTLKEPVAEQPAMLSFGTLKEYQVSLLSCVCVLERGRERGRERERKRD